MPIDPYYEPQLNIFQELQRTSSSQVPRMAACIIGPSYLLSRYGHEDTEDVEHVLAGQVLPWRYVDANGAVQDLPADYEVDLDSVQLWAKNLRAPLATFDAEDFNVVLEAISSPHIIKLIQPTEFTTDYAGDANEIVAPGHTFTDGKKVRVLTYGGTAPAPLNGNTAYYVVNSGVGVLELSLTSGGSPITLTSDGTGTHALMPLETGSSAFKGEGFIPSILRGRECVIGDEVVVNDGTTSRTRTIVGFLGADVPSSYGSNAEMDNGEAANAAYNPVTDTTADSAVEILTPSGFTQAIVQTLVNFNVRGSSLSVNDRKVSEDYTITVTEGGTPGTGGGTATFSISSKSGIYAATGVKSTDDGGDYLIDDAELAGAEVTISGGTVSVGQVFKFRVFQGYEQLVDGDQIAVSGTYTGPSDTTYIVEVTQGSTGDSATGAEVKIYDSEGLEEVQEEVEVTENTAISLGAYGLSFTFTLGSTTVEQKGLRAGDKYYVHALAASQDDIIFDKAVLNGPVIDPATFVDLGAPLTATISLRYTGEIAATAAADESAWTADAADGISVDAALALHVPARDSGYEWVSFEDGTGVLHTSFRAAIPTSTAVGMGYVDDSDDIAEKIGPIALANDLAFGCSEALRGAQGRRVYFVNTGGATPAHFTAALKKLEATTQVWALCVLTEDPAVKAVAEAHVLAMSAPSKKNFRKLYTGIDSPGKYAIYEKQANDAPYTFTVTDNGAGANTLVTLIPPADGTDFDSLNIVSGDLLRVTSSGVEYAIDSVISATELRLKAGPALPVSPAIPMQIWKADTAASQGSFVKAAAASLSHRRVTQMWYEDGSRVLSGTTPTIIPARFGAAELAGLRTALPPQVGLSRQEMQVITAAPAMYNKYGIDELNDIAASGVLIVTQTAENGAVFIRHQLTTESDDALGALYYEDNITMIVDYLSFRFRDEFESSIGRVNVTNGSIANIFSRAVTILDEEKQADIDSIYGPLIKDYRDLSVTRDAALKDKVKIRVKIAVPLPMNLLDITFETYVDLPEEE